jgi:hypothetical protein
MNTTMQEKREALIDANKEVGLEEIKKKIQVYISVSSPE